MKGDRGRDEAQESGVRGVSVSSSLCIQCLLDHSRKKKRERGKRRGMREREVIESFKNMRERMEGKDGD